MTDICSYCYDGCLPPCGIRSNECSALSGVYVRQVKEKFTCARDSLTVYM